MAVIRLYPTKDTSIANYDDVSGYVPSVITSSNVGASEILNLYQTSFGSQLSAGLAQAHVLVQFDLTALPPVIAASGATFFLSMFDAQHAETLPSEFDVIIAEVSGNWSEGQGLDMDLYTDLGAASWVSSTVTSSWDDPGGDAQPGHDLSFGAPLPLPFFSGTSASFYFQTGHEDMVADVSIIAQDWLSYGTTNSGFIIFINPALTGTDLYIKKFHSRQTHFLEKRPFLEVRYTDWTGSLSTSSLFLITQPGPWSGSYGDPRLSATMTGALVSVTNSLVDPTGALDLFVYDMKTSWESSETPTLHVQVQPHNWNPAAVASASLQVTGVALLDAYYRVVDDETGDELMPFGTGALKHTKLSFNDQGNYFQFRMDTVPPGKVCRFDFGYNISGTWSLVQGPKFRVR